MDNTIIIIIIISIVCCISLSFGGGLGYYFMTKEDDTKKDDKKEDDKKDTNRYGGLVWSSGTADQGVGPYQLKYQNDYNLVIYDSNSKAIWSTGTWNQKSQFLKMSDDGNLKLFDGYNENVNIKWSAVPITTCNNVGIYKTTLQEAKSKTNNGKWYGLVFNPSNCNEYVRVFF
jgi:hypothetical protein